jgi:hypothetical protein
MAIEELAAHRRRDPSIGDDGQNDENGPEEARHYP